MFFSLWSPHSLGVICPSRTCKLCPGWWWWCWCRPYRERAWGGGPVCAPGISSEWSKVVAEIRANSYEKPPVMKASAWALSGSVASWPAVRPWLPHKFPSLRCQLLWAAYHSWGDAPPPPWSWTTLKTFLYRVTFLESFIAMMKNGLIL